MHKHGIHHLRDGYIPCSAHQSWGKFGRLFPTLPAHEPDPRDLVALGLKDGPMDEGSRDETPDSKTIPAGFTFLGQFIDHDITFDPTSSLERQNDPTAIRNFRTPLLELDCVYGAGPGANPFLYDKDDPDKLLIGTKANPNGDLPRNLQGTALIGDPRNDENIIVSQLQLAFLKLHNAVVDYLRASGLEAGRVFAEAQRLVRWHYQWLVVNEFLPLTIGQHRVDEILRDGLRYYQPGSTPFIPLEFSVAAYRFGHSQVRAAYRINKKTEEELFDLPFFAPIQVKQQIDWSNFFQISNTRPQFSRKIDTRLTRTLLDLPAPIVPVQVPVENRSLAIRNLKRGVSFDLPTGQAVAKIMGIQPLSDEALGLSDLELPGKGFNGEAPLWYYILKEAEVQTEGETLGQVGGRLVGEVLLGLLQADPMSYLNIDPRWQPDATIAPNGEFVDLLRFAGVVAAPAPKPVSQPKSRGRKKTKAKAKPAKTKQLAGQLHLHHLDVTMVEGETTPNMLHHSQPFNIELGLDLSETELPPESDVTYKAVVNAKSLNGGSRQILGQTEGKLTINEPTMVIDMAGKPLEEGLYRLEATVNLILQPEGAELAALLEGNLIQVQ